MQRQFRPTKAGSPLFKIGIAAGLFAASAILGAATPKNVLHRFAGGTADGRIPAGGVTMAGHVLYGSTRYGGAQNHGVIFRMNTDGSGYTVLHHFVGGANDGNGPVGTLVVANSIIYGATLNGGASNFGTVFSMDVIGGNFKLLHTFPDSASDGTTPGGVLLVGSTLYGLTELGGTDGLGVIFKMDVAGTGYSILHQFATGTSDGHLPFGTLTLSGSTLFGTTAQGGSNGAGVIFKIDLSGANYTILRQFVPPNGDPYNTEHSLTLVGSTLYGVSNQGGPAGIGTIFKINTNGTGYGVIHSFDGADGNDGHPSSALILVNNHLIGSTDPIDPGYPGWIYSIALDGGGFGVLHRFNAPSIDGRDPGADLLLDGLITYGVTASGGIENGGVVYAMPALRISSVSRTNSNEFQLSGETLPNSTISIRTSDDLADDFPTVMSATADATGAFQLNDPALTTVPAKFYRAAFP